MDSLLILPLCFQVIVPLQFGSTFIRLKLYASIKSNTKLPFLLIFWSPINSTCALNSPRRTKGFVISCSRIFFMFCIISYVVSIIVQIVVWTINVTESRQSSSLGAPNIFKKFPLKNIVCVLRITAIPIYFFWSVKPIKRNKSLFIFNNKHVYKQWKKMKIKKWLHFPQTFRTAICS